MAKKSDKNEKDTVLNDKLNNAVTEIKRKSEEKVTEKPFPKPTDPPTKDEKKEDVKEPPKPIVPTDTTPEESEDKKEPEIDITVTDMSNLLDLDEKVTESEDMGESEKETESEIEPPKSNETSDVVTTNPPDTEMKHANLLRKILNSKIKKPDTSIPKKSMNKQEVMNSELERIRQKTVKDELKKRQQTTTVKQISPKSARDLLKQPEKTIMIKLKDRVINIRPNIDKIFAFVCRGFDEGLKEPCYRFVKSLTFRQVINFKRFIEEFGCMCRDKSNHDITLDPFLDQIAKDLPIKIKEYDGEFLKIYYNEYVVNNVVGLVDKIVDENTPDSEDDEEDDTDSEEDGFSEDELEAKAKATQDDDTDLEDNDE